MGQSNSQALIIGAGAVGAFYGACLNKAGVSVSAVCRSDYDSIAEHGFVIDSALGDLSFRPATLLRTVSEVCQPPDYLVLCVKVVDGLDRAELIRPAVGPDTAIVLIENGLGIEAELAQAYPDNILLSAVAYVAVSRVATGEIKHFNDGRLMLGEFPVATGEAASKLSALFALGGITANVVESITRERWRKKCVWNAVLNTVSVVADGADTKTMVTAPGGEALLREMLREVCVVAAEAGYVSTHRGWTLFTASSTCACDSVKISRSRPDRIVPRGEV